MLQTLPVVNVSQLKILVGLTLALKREPEGPHPRLVAFTNTNPGWTPLFRELETPHWDPWINCAYAAGTEGKWGGVWLPKSLKVVRAIS